MNARLAAIGFILREMSLTEFRPQRHRFQTEDPRPYETGGASDPFAPYFTGTQPDWLKNFPWQDLQAVTLNYGKPVATGPGSPGTTS